MVGGGGLTADVRKLRLPDTATRTLGVAAGLAGRVALVGWGDEAGRLALGRAKGLPPLLSEWKTCFDWTFNFSSTNVLAYCCVQNHETDYRMKIRSNMNPSVSDLYIYTMQNNKLKDKYQFKPKKFDSKSIQF